MTSDADVRQDGRPAQHREAQMAQLHDGTSRPRRAALLAVTFAVTSLLGGCGGGTQPPAAKGTASGQATSSAPAYGGGTSAGTAPSRAAAPATLTVRATTLGRILAGGGGRTVYLFEKDSGTTSQCAGACAAAWPPVTTTGPVTATGGAQAGLVGTTTRADGTRQVTYAGHPLYYFKGDTAPGAVTGQGLKAFGAEWYVLAPTGAKIERG